MELTKALERLLVAVSARDVLVLGFCAGHLGLEGGEPAITLDRVGSFEFVVLAVEEEGEFAGAVLGQRSGFRLGRELATLYHCQVSRRRSYQENGTRRCGLILGPLGVEQDTLASFLSPGGGLGHGREVRFLALDVRGQGLFGRWL